MNRLKDRAGSNRNITRYIKHYLAISFFVSITVHFFMKKMPIFVGTSMLKYSPFIGRGDGVLRAIIYFGVMYVFVIPPYAILFHQKLKGYNVPVHKFLEKIAYTIFCVIFLSAMCLFPFLFLLTDNTAHGYAGFVYEIMTGSVVGLSVIGASFSYAVTLCFWLLLYSVPKMWIGNSN